MAMTSKERMMRALHREKPDRLPVSVHQWQGFHLDNYMNGMSDLEAFQHCGMDAQIQYFQDMGQFWLVDADYTKCSTAEWKDEAEAISTDPDHRVMHHTIRTPGGDLTYKTEGDRKTTWITEYLVKRDEDLDLIEKYMPVPTLNPRPLEKVYDQLGDNGILRGFVWGDQAGCWQHACCLMDVNELIPRAMIDPDWVHRFLKILLQKKMRFIESLEGAKFDVIETGGGASSSTLVSPDFHRDFCLAYDKPMHEALTAMGFLVSYHTCGGTLGIEEHIVANGCTASETLAPPSIGGNQEPWELKKKVGNRIALIGGMDQFNTVTDGDEATIRAKVRELFEKVGYEGGYILSMADHFFETPVENLKIYADEARNCVY